MNYIVEINEFNRWSSVSDISANGMLLWYKLMDIANSVGWEENLSISMSTLEAKCKRSKRAILYAREELVKLGLLQTIERGANRATIYKLVPFEKNNSVSNILGSQKDSACNSECTSACTSACNICTLYKPNKTKQYIDIENQETKEITIQDVEQRKASFIQDVYSHQDQYKEWMLKEFINHWTEPTPKSNRMLYEKQKTWNTAMRLNRWFSNGVKWGSIDKETGNQIVNEYGYSTKQSDNERFKRTAKEITATLTSREESNEFIPSFAKSNK